jgi:hypothetical protein
MNSDRPTESRPLTLGLFDKRIEGDDSLMELARLRFRQTGLGAEMHAGTPERLEWVLRFRPAPEAPVFVHLPPDWNWAQAQNRGRIAEMMERFAGRVHGWVLHDHLDMAARPAEFLRAAGELETRLQKVGQGAMVFVEYAAGLEPAVFARFCAALGGLGRISACVDIGHVGIWQARQTYARFHPGEDLCALKDQHSVPRGVMADVASAIRASLPAVLRLINALGALRASVHFHLHDGHPLSTASPFGVADHLSFLDEVPLRFEHQGRRAVSPMFGPDGLRQIAAQAMAAIGPARASFTLEIHPTFARRPLGDAAPLFSHWTDRTNAEKMNHWLFALGQNHALLREAVRLGLGSPS